MLFRILGVAAKCTKKGRDPETGPSTLHFLFAAMKAVFRLRRSNPLDGAGGFFGPVPPHPRSPWPSPHFAGYFEKMLEWPLAWAAALCAALLAI